MLTTPSRRQRREAKFQYMAEHGYMHVEDIPLFKSEAKSLTKERFCVIRSIPAAKGSVPSTVSWEYAFKGVVIPPLVSNYINGITDTFPYPAVSNWAQELYVIAARANKKKAQTKPE